jgi:hypothetical protein
MRLILDPALATDDASRLPVALLADGRLLNPRDNVWVF